MPGALVGTFLDIEGKLLPLARKDFCTAVKEVLMEGSPEGGPAGLFPCLKEIPPSNPEIYADVDLCEGEDYKQFQEEMIPTYEKMLQGFKHRSSTANADGDVHF